MDIAILILSFISIFVDGALTIEDRVGNIKKIAINWMSVIVFILALVRIFSR